MMIDTIRKLVTDLRCGASTSHDIGVHIRKYQDLCNRAADALTILAAVDWRNPEGKKDDRGPSSHPLTPGA